MTKIEELESRIAALEAQVAALSVPRDEDELFSRLMRSAADATGVDLKDLCGATRRFPVPVARFAVMYALYRKHGWTLVRIGKAMKRDHATVRHGILAVEAILCADKPDPRVQIVTQVISA